MAKRKIMTIDGRPIKYGTIVPLIGGMSVANKTITGSDPSFFLSYPGFESNDAHAVNHFKKTHEYLEGGKVKKSLLTRVQRD